MSERIKIGKMEEDGSISISKDNQHIGMIFVQPNGNELWLNAVGFNSKNIMIGGSLHRLINGVKK